MKLHTVFITHNRLELTKKAIASYLSTVTAQNVMWVVDNASTDGTQEWLQENVRELGQGFTLLRENKYPGAACNEGWRMSEIAIWGSQDEPDYLQRADNDFVFLPGWCEEVERMFANNDRLGQLGMRTDEEELFAPLNVGGNNIIKRELWDKGLRYDERTWPQIRKQVSPGYSEDSLFSPAVRAMGYEWDRVERPCVVNIDQKDRKDPYYAKSFADRGIKWT